MDKISSFQSFEQAMQGLSRRLSARGAMRESVILRLFQHVALRLNDYMDEPFKSHGLNTTLWTSLVVIYASPDHRLKPSELSVFMNSSRTNSTRVARELAGRGFVDRVDDETDRRQLFLQLTKKGLAFVEDFLPPRRAYVKQALEGFSADEVDELERLLRKLLHKLD
ncbi:MarR family transcriptional regulator [Paralcaligenes sp. KSB-10]|jgi:MarR family transcriptional repressor of emrRAB|uniref:MarR family transcriptional regulator n=1 Tax=Paralcaligenes sp. KSB-10 TaxID=2901142 RepID=UPI001E42ED5D|nr:MarR family transcriptional regulator [Paralcaligenes sp. KSB-10]UHL64028.1 MarR family transcriptional regulator [Paralcaligenes sp. KSB-10]